MAEGLHPVRVFLVGFPRSGTTLLQSLLAAHPEVMSLPETFFFTSVAPPGRRWRLLHRAHPDARARLHALEGHGVEVPRPGLREALPLGSVGPTVRRFVSSLDRAASQRGKRAWVEKTPSHLHHLDLIERYVADAEFVHIVRTGLPAVASLQAVTRQHPEPWGGARSIETCVSRWRADIRRSHRCVEKPNHRFVSYERLVEDPGARMLSLTRQLGLRSDPETIQSMLDGYGESAPGLVDNEPWKSAVGSPIANRNGARAAELFSTQQQVEIERELVPEERLREAMPFL
jgi:Sulfotransferase family